MIRVAVTRSEPQAHATATRLRALGAEPVLAPLLTIVPCAFDTNVEAAQALLFTSSNGVRAFPDVRAVAHLPVLAVGDATAEAARAAGFTDVRSAGGDGAALAALARATLDPHAGRLIHISGADVAGDLAGALAQAGFAVERRIAYAARAAARVPDAFATPLDIVLFHSPRAARIFLDLGAPGAAGLVAACLSPAVADAAAGAPWRRLKVAPAPREADLLDAALCGQDASGGASA